MRSARRIGVSIDRILDRHDETSRIVVVCQQQAARVGGLLQLSAPPRRPRRTDPLRTATPKDHDPVRRHRVAQTSTGCRREREVIMATAVVSGGGTGIGKAIAAALAADGFDVVIVGRRADVLDGVAAEINAALPSGRNPVCAETGDVSDPGDLERLADVIVGGSAVVDVVVSNAGAPARSSVRDLHELAESWLAALRSNTPSARLLRPRWRPIFHRRVA